MLRFYHQLFFPTLRRIGDVNFKVWPSSSSTKTTDLYKLDWSSKDNACKRKHEAWVRKQYPDKEVLFFATLPEKYENQIQDLKFAIPTHYLKEIRENVRKGLMEWTRERIFDSRIREICMEPAISFLRVAFELLADCTYDDKENYFYRGNDKILIPYMMLYRFWTYQTSKEGVWYNSGCDRLQNLTQKETIVNDFISTIRNEYESVVDKAYESLQNGEEK